MGKPLTSLLKIVDTNGRAGRREYLFFFLVSGVLCPLAVAVVKDGIRRSLGAEVLLGAALALAAMAPACAVIIRRLHDADRTGLWLLVPSVGCRAGLLIVDLAGGGPDLQGDVGLTILVVFLAGVGLLKGTPGNNQYGPGSVAPP